MPVSFTGLFKIGPWIQLIMLDGQRSHGLRDWLVFKGFFINFSMTGWRKQSGCEYCRLSDLSSQDLKVYMCSVQEKYRGKTNTALKEPLQPNPIKFLGRH